MPHQEGLCPNNWVGQDASHKGIVRSRHPSKLSGEAVPGS